MFKSILLLNLVFVYTFNVAKKTWEEQSPFALNIIQLSLKKDL
jgi:hypothetical protein